MFGVLKSLINIHKNFLCCQEINIKETESKLLLFIDFFMSGGS